MVKDRLLGSSGQHMEVAVGNWWMPKGLEYEFISAIGH